MFDCEEVRDLQIRGVSKMFLGHFNKILFYGLNLQLKPSKMAPFWVDWVKKGVCRNV
jgi:hypothetical protein